MTEHLSQEILSAIADRELTPAQLSDATAHLDACPRCAAAALGQNLLKASVAKAGRSFDPPAGFEGRLSHLLQRQSAATGQHNQTWRSALRNLFSSPFHATVWAAAAVVLIAATFIVFYERVSTRSGIEAVQQADLAAEAVDQHIGALAHNAPQVVSSDRHTVKPWFQGKLPFSFNLPPGLPQETTLDGANLAYLRGEPAAQLLFHIGKHGASVFLLQNGPGKSTAGLPQQHAGFHLASSRSGELEIIAVSDVEPARLNDLVNVIGQAQR